MQAKTTPMSSSTAWLHGSGQSAGSRGRPGRGRGDAIFRGLVTLLRGGNMRAIQRQHSLAGLLRRYRMSFWNSLAWTARRSGGHRSLGFSTPAAFSVSVTGLIDSTGFRS